MSCRICNEPDYYLQYKGTAVGLYCASCGKWQKWVGKKDLPKYTRGKTIHKEGIFVTLKGGSTENLGVIESIVTNKVELKIEKNNEEPSWVQEVTSSKHISLDSEEDCPFVVEPKFEVQPKYDERIDIPELTECPICNGENLQKVGDSVVDILIYDGVMTITNNDGSEVLGMYKLLCCPYCGRKY